MRGIGYLLAFGGAAAGLAVTGGPGAPANPATAVNRFDVVAVPGGPPGEGAGRRRERVMVSSSGRERWVSPPAGLLRRRPARG